MQLRAHDNNIKKWGRVCNGHTQSLLEPDSSYCCISLQLDIWSSLPHFCMDCEWIQKTHWTRNCWCCSQCVWRAWKLCGTFVVSITHLNQHSHWNTEILWVGTVCWKTVKREVYLGKLVSVFCLVFPSL